MNKAPSESGTYQKMLADVEQITREISTDQVDLDQLVGKIEQGYALINKMRERLDQTKEKLEKLGTEPAAE